MAPSIQVAPATSASVIIDHEQTLKASKALVAHVKKAAKEKVANAPKKNILADVDDEESLGISETPIWLTLTTKRQMVNSKRLKPSKIALPHPLNTDPNSSICIITADPQRAYKNIVASEEFPEELRKRITRVIDYTKLRAKYRQYEAQRQLFAEHEIFLGDDRIINRLPQALGKTFYKSTSKRPIPVVLSAKRDKVDGKKVPRKKGEEIINAGAPKDIAAEIEKAAGSALVALSPSTNTAIKVGYAAWTPEQIAANVETVVAALVEKHVPQKWNNVKSIYIKGPETAALPIWLTEELWLNDNDVIPDSEAPQAAEEAEKPNVGKKRKSMGGGEIKRSAPLSKKPKVLPESNDDKLVKQIADTKEKLKKQKAKAKASLD